MFRLSRWFAFKNAGGSGKRALVNDSDQAVVEVSASALPDGAATSAKQDTAATLLAAIGTLIESTNALLTAIQSTEGIKKIVDTVDVSVSTLPSIPSGTNAIGTVEVTKSPKGTKRSPAAPAAMSSTAAQIVAANASRKSVLIQNVGASTVYLGKDNSVSSSAYTVRLRPGESLSSDDVSTDAWYGVCAAGETSSVAHEEVT